MKCIAIALVLLLANLAAAQDRPGRGAAPPADVQRLADLSIILGRPTDKSVVVSILSAQPREAYIEYGTASGNYTSKTDAVKLSGGQAIELTLDKLDRDTAYFYCLQSRKMGDAAFTAGDQHTFHSLRPAGSTFTFGVQGDSHPEREGKMYDPALYAQTLRAVAKDAPDFYMLMGDDFSIERLIARDLLSQAAVDQIYAYQRGFLGIAGASSAIFLVNGNHEQAARANLDGTPTSPAVLAARARTHFFPLPSPDSFYGGDAEQVKNVGLVRDYYAWTWGDALFVVIDPYWHSAVSVDSPAGVEGGEKKRDLWDVTLGDAQYRWLTKTLTESKARWKFVFSHHVLGTGRGGIECASLCEWGGKNRRGEDEFARKRPGWELPIHQLFVKTGVTIFFQGHDHLFARQQLDGVVYQSCPNPADPTYQAFNGDAYHSGDILPNSGHLRVTVSPAKVRVEYVRSYLPRDATQQHPDGEIAFAYDVLSSKPTPATTQVSAARGPQGGFHTDVPAHAIDVILGRPTATSITLSLLSYADTKAQLGYAVEDVGIGTPAIQLAKGIPQEIVLSKLLPDTRYSYELADVATGKAMAAGTFHTQRAPGSTFTFTVQADSHLDENTNTDLYQRTLANALADAPDFHIDLGDTFMTDRHDGRESAARQYLAQRYYLGLIGRSAPIFLVLGNHDGEDGKLRVGQASSLSLDETGRMPVSQSLAIWSNAMRKRYFPNPIPDAFYCGNNKKEPLAGLLQDYYAWEWGDALFVVLDPYWHSPTRRGDDCWGLTLGRDQYEWLGKTLSSSKSKYKFVFIHQLVGGVGNQGRGGIEAACFGEWGGKNADGSEGFAVHRPGWEMPIHELLVHNHVTAVFHGHDHLYATQELDGIIYQEVPQPGFAGTGPPRQAAEYGYTMGEILGGCGHLRVTVSPSGTKVQFVVAVLPRH